MRVQNTQPFIVLRCLSEWNTIYNVFVSTCLETGNCVTADDLETVNSMILELLQDELTLALGRQSFTNLLSNPADLVTWINWLYASSQTPPTENRLSLIVPDILVTTLGGAIRADVSIAMGRGK